MDYDVITIGGGPGGAAAATLLAQRGYRVLLLERADRPGFWQSVTGSQESGEALEATAAREVLDLLLDPKRSRDGLFPELVVFDCHACHHAMSDRRWTPNGCKA